MKKNKKAFIPKAQNGIEGTMGGLTDKGFNYNGAWGGTMQKGGKTFLQPNSPKLPTAQIGDWLKKTASVINPFNWGVTDYSDKKDFDSAYASARNAGEKEFMWNNQRFSTNMKGTPSEQLKWSGITDDRLGIQGKLERRAYKAVRPSVYDKEEDVKTQVSRFIKGGDRFDLSEYSKLSKELQDADKKQDYTKAKSILKKLESFDENLMAEDDPYSEDAWRIYLGMPQKNSSFGISEYKPTISKGDKNVNYYNLPESFKNELADLYQKGQIKVGLNNEFDFSSKFGQNQNQARALGNFTVGKGKDEKGEYISYYDIYDLTPTLSSVGKVDVENFVGKPFEIYDRVYINPKKDKSVVDKKQQGGNLPGAMGNMYARHGAPSEGKYAKKTLPSAQKGMQFYQQGLDFKPKTISKNGGWLSKYEDIPQAQIGISASESTALPRNIDPRMRAALEEDMKRTKNIIAEETKREKQGVIKNTKPFEVKDTRHWQSDSKAKERSNNPNVDFSLGVLADTFIDQIPYLAITNASEAFNSGQPLMGMSELLKQPYGPRGDAWVNFFQENPSNINIKTLEGKVVGNSDISKKQNTKLSKAEQYIANDPYFFAEESDPSFIKSLDRPFTHLRNLGAKVAFDRNPKALLNLLSIGALGSIGSRKNGGVVESYMRGLTDQGFNGSEIKKDDMGYWNPDNWGKPVEIGSNEITMDGVYQPLLGISNTGDVQMMYPGEDYTFDGESVTEYPIMKNGGWLDKYK